MKSGVNRRAPRHSCAIRWRSKPPRKSVKRRCPLPSPLLARRPGFFHARAVSCAEISSVRKCWGREKGKKRKTISWIIYHSLRFQLLEFSPPQYGCFLGRRNFSTRLEERGGFPREEESKGAGTVIPLRFLLSWSTFVLALIEEKKRERKGKRERGRGIIELSVCQQVARHRDTVVFKSGKTFFPPDWKHSKKEKKKRKIDVSISRVTLSAVQCQSLPLTLSVGEKRGWKGKTRERGIV